MRAINLIPLDQRRGGPGVAGRSGSNVYVLLGGLGVVLVALVAYVLTLNSINDREAELSRVTDEANRVEAQAAALKPYRDFQLMRAQRTTTVAGLATSRFSWDLSLRQLAQVLPSDVELTTVTGTIAPGVNIAGSGAGSSGGASVRAAVNAPAIELVGCTGGQAQVARIMSRLRRMTGVSRVSLSASEKIEQQSLAGGSAPAAAGAGAANDSDCRSNSPSRPQFNLTVFFNPLPGQGATAPGAGAAPAPVGGAPANVTAGAAR